MTCRSFIVGLSDRRGKVGGQSNVKINSSTICLKTCRCSGTKTNKAAPKITGTRARGQNVSTELKKEIHLNYTLVKLLRNWLYVHQAVTVAVSDCNGEIRLHVTGSSSAKFGSSITGV